MKVSGTTTRQRPPAGANSRAAGAFTVVPPTTRRATPRDNAAPLEAQGPWMLGAQLQFLGPDDLVNVARASKYLNHTINSTRPFQSIEAERLKTAQARIDVAEQGAHEALRPLMLGFDSAARALTIARREADAFPAASSLPWYSFLSRKKVQALSERVDRLRDVLDTFERVGDVLAGQRERIDAQLEPLRADLANCRAAFYAARHADRVAAGPGATADEEATTPMPTPADVPVAPYAPSRSLLRTRITPSSSNSGHARLEKLPDAVLRTIEAFLAPQDLAHLTDSSRTLRRDVREHVRYAEAKRFQDARKAHLEWLEDKHPKAITERCMLVSSSGPFAGRFGSALASGIYQHTPFTATCISIAQARADRGEPHEVFAAMSAARRFLANPLARFLSYADERLLVEAAYAHGATPLTAAVMHKNNSEARERARQDRDVFVWAGDLRANIAVLESQLAEVATADLRSATDAIAPKRPERPVVYIEHFADEITEPGDMIEQSHAFPDGSVQTARQPRPDAQAAEAMATFEFTKRGFLGQTYVHVFNLERPVIDMEAPD